MSVKQASVQTEELHWSQLPDSWPQIVKEDWQNKTNGINEVAEVANEANVTANSEVDKNKNQDKAIELNRKSIDNLSENVGSLNQRVSLNSQGIATNKSGVAANKTATETNALAITQNADNLNTHEQLNSAHGVTGNNVGTENYAQELIGGVVLLAGNIAELTAYTAPVAPAAYSQAEEQAFRDRVQSEVNKLIGKVNELIQGQITAKQMANNAPP